MNCRVTCKIRAAVVGALAIALMSTTSLVATPSAVASPNVESPSSIGYFTYSEPHCVVKTFNFDAFYCIWEEGPAYPTEQPSPPSQNPPHPPAR